MQSLTHFISGREFHHEFFVVRQLSYKLILGLDWLRRVGAVIDCAKLLICLPGLKPVQCISTLNARPAFGRVQVEHTVRIPVRAYACIEVPVNNIREGTEVYVNWSRISVLFV